MLNSSQVKKFLFYSLIALTFTAYPALAQGEEIVQTDEILKIGEIVVLVSADLAAISSLCFMRLAVMQSQSSAFDLPIVMSLAGIFMALAGSLAFGFTFKLIIVVIANLILFLSALVVRAIHYQTDE